MANPSDPAHKYVGTVADSDPNTGLYYDVYQLYDAGQNRVLEWRVLADDLSGNIINGSLRDLGPPSRATIAQAPSVSGGEVAPGSTANIVRGITSDSRHIYLSRDANGDRWGMSDGTTRLEWLVNFGAPSGQILPGTLRNLGPVVANPLPPPPVNSTPSTAPGANTVGTQAAPPPNTVSNVPVGSITDPRHTYAGRDERGDKWRLVDEGGSVIQWYTLPGNSSGAKIPGSETVVMLGSGRPNPSNGTGANTGNTGTNGAGSPAAPAPAGTGIGLITVLGVVLSALK